MLRLRQFRFSKENRRTAIAAAWQSSRVHVRRSERHMRICVRSESPRARWDLDESPSRSRFLIAHDLFGKPLHTFPDHALGEEGAARAFSIPRVERRFPTCTFIVPHLDEFYPLALHRPSRRSVDPIRNPAANDCGAGHRTECLFQAIAFLTRQPRFE